MNFETLKDDPTIIEWLDILNPRKNTEKAYLQAMRFYTEWTGKEPAELIEEAEAEIKAGKLMRQRCIKKNLIGFRKYLLDQGNADYTIKSRMTGVKSFYSCFDIEIPKLPRAGTKAKTLEHNKAIPSKEEIQDALKICDPLETAIVLCGVSSGLSTNEIVTLKIRTFKEGYDPETEITTLDLRRGKVGVDFITFLSPEASRAVWEYLEFRNKTPKFPNAEKLRTFEKQKISDDGYLFINRNVSHEYLKNHDEELRKLQPRNLVQMYRNISEKARKNTSFGNWNLIRSHNMRKYFNSALLNAGADSFFTEYVMGHTIDDTRAAYFRASPEKLREIYQNYVPYLTISKEADVSESPEFQKMKRENKALQAELVTKAVDRSELSELRRELEELKKTEALKVDAENRLDPEWMKILIEKVKEEMSK